MPIPTEIDFPALIQQLKDLKWSDREIEDECGFRHGYLTQVRGGYIKEMSYDKGAKLYNLWLRECHPGQPQSPQ